MNYCFNLTEVIVAIIGAIGISSFITIKIINKNTVTQSNNKVGKGDIIGGDKKTGSKIS